jgi:tetratricopeptide (TPR) repeat protein
VARLHRARHTGGVKRVLLFGLLLAGPAYADRVADVEDLEPVPAPHEFWRDVSEPHGVEIDDILMKANAAVNRGEATFIAETDPTGEGRQKLFHELFGMLRYARRLAPGHLAVLQLYAQTADAIGKTREAMDALHAAIDLVGPDKAGPSITGQLGAIYLRLGQLDDAVHYLRMAQGPVLPGAPNTARVLVNLSTALALRGQTTDAFDVLADSMPTAPSYYYNEYQLVTFALAVAYDRDDQRSAAVAQLEQLRSNLHDQWGPMVTAAIASFRFSPAEDQQYYRALLLEATDNYVDARAEWALYAAGRGTYARRALEHIAAIDKRPRTPTSALAPGHP